MLASIHGRPGRDRLRRPRPLFPRRWTPGPVRGQHGFALVLAVVVVAVAAGAIGVALSSGGLARGASASTRAARALECSHAGTARGKVAVLGLFGAGASLGDVIAKSSTEGQIVADPLQQGMVRVRFADNDDGDGDPATDSDLRTVMRSTCRVGTSESTVEVLGQGGFASAFSAASCGCSAISFNGAAVTTDSYDSLAGPYDPVANAGARGNLQGNGTVFVTGTVAGDVIGTGDVDGNGTITGNVYAGGSVDTANLTVLGTVFQNVNPPPRPCRCNNGIDVAARAAAAAASNDNLGLGAQGCWSHIDGLRNRLRLNNTSCTLSSGTYYFEEVRINGTGELRIDPTLDPLDPNDNVVLYLGGSGPFRFNGGGIVNASEHALDLEIYSSSTADTDLSGAASFSGLVYAPFSALDIGGNMEVHGGLFSDDIQNSGSAALHFDENLLERQDFLAEWRRRAGTWRIVN